MRNGGYELVIAPPEYPGKKYRGRYVYEHHLVWWKHTGQLVPVGFDLHHKDENKRRNVYDNLELKKHGAHIADHNAVEREVLLCGYCSAEMKLLPSVVLTRMKQSRSGKLFCSRRCGALHQHS